MNNWKANQNKLYSLVDRHGVSNLFAHSDIIKSIEFIDTSKVKNQSGLINAHCELLNSLNTNLYLPHFNYDFPKRKQFDYDNFISQVGVLSEYYSEKYESHKTFDPMFSVITTSPYSIYCKHANEVDSFSKDGIFSRFSTKNSAILFYGCNLSSLTFIHYVETITSSPYRYRKSIKGESIFKGDVAPLTFKSHFRPLVGNVSYDWNKIEQDLLEEGIYQQISQSTSLLLSKEFFDYALVRLQEEPLYFLQADSKRWVQDKLDILGRPFLVEDFE
ncbi:AAC(3) family N-acetyltransferase [Vibrio brasiliensis]|uniref:AAC(3) family N-acetyltransferase n=1 Tax=Vibrio brasiliensis TaxID=170652 RepID=UPI001EFE9E2E|nr:AAC(3) family N-acetyltransferase [Vibrio brasiliensis]MCG9753459.1 AAC(3) family N-acetyltransferase [Vibrio brasiliensis]